MPIQNHGAIIRTGDNGETSSSKRESSAKAAVHHRAKTCSPACTAENRRRSLNKAWNKWYAKAKEGDKANA